MIPKKKFITKIRVSIFAQSSHPDDNYKLLRRIEESKQKTRGINKMDPRDKNKPAKEEDEENWFDEEWEDEDFDEFEEYEDDDDESY